MNIPLTAACYAVLCLLILVSIPLALLYEQDEELSKEAENQIGRIFI